MEILSPAGHWEAMVAAVQNGADAVYFGVGDYNARRGARNFTLEELPRAVAYCHLRGVRVYLTVNTLLTDRELSGAADLLREASRCGVDAIIVQDWGVVSLARAVAPDLPLHGSTQMSVHTLSGVEALGKLGIRCAVLARELSGEEIAAICERSPMAIEVFGHGALCMCYSGQCAMSALIGGRSGNRGACAQPCRLPYAMDGGKQGHPLSLKDACLARYMPELLRMGVASLKLEGRMKRPEYVAVITQIYNRLCKENRAATAEEEETLALAFSRSGFTDGYWRGRKGPDMFGTRPENHPDAGVAVPAFSVVLRDPHVAGRIYCDVLQPAGFALPDADRMLEGARCTDEADPLLQRHLVTEREGPAGGDPVLTWRLPGNDGVRVIHALIGQQTPGAVGKGELAVPQAVEMFRPDRRRGISIGQPDGEGFRLRIDLLHLPL